MKTNNISNNQKFWRMFNVLFANPMIGSATGFGIFWVWMLSGVGVWASILIALYCSGLMNMILLVKEES